MPKVFRCYMCKRKFWRADGRPNTITHGCESKYTICTRCYHDDRKVVPPCPVCKLALGSAPPGR